MSWKLFLITNQFLKIYRNSKLQTNLEKQLSDQLEKQLFADQLEKQLLTS
jgi:hypothetical protein